MPVTAAAAAAGASAAAASSSTSSPLPSASGWRLPRAGGVAEEAGSGCGDCGGCGTLARSKDAALLSLSSCEWRMAAQRKQNLTRHLVHCPPTLLTSLHAKHLRKSGRGARARARVVSPASQTLRARTQARKHASSAHCSGSAINTAAMHALPQRWKSSNGTAPRRKSAFFSKASGPGLLPWP